MEHGFQEGQKVVCISQDFPVIKKYGGTGKEAQSTPNKGEIIRINEILGDFLRFDKYDTDESNNWWIASNFRALDDITPSIEEIIKEIAPLELVNNQIF